MIQSIRRARQLTWLSFALVMILVHGCSNGRKPAFAVQGKAFKGSEPLAGAMVVFHPVNAAEKDLTRPSGVVAEDGSFQLTTYDANDGAPEGEYVVTLLWQEKPKGAAGLISENKGFVPDRLKGAYSDPKTSKLKAKVEKSQNNAIKLEAS